MRTYHALSVYPALPALKPFIRRGLPLALLCAVGGGNMPLAAYAQQTRSVPVPGGLSVVGTLFVLKQDAPAASPASVLVSIDAKNASLATLIDLLMEQAHASYTLSQKLTNAPVGNAKLRRVPLRAALDAILKMSEVPVTYQVEEGIYRILPKTEPTAEAGSASVPMNVQAASPAPPKVHVEMGPITPDAKSGATAEPRFSISVREAPLSEALTELFGQAHMSLSLTEMTRRSRVTVTLYNQPLRVVLDTLLKASGQPFSYRVENGVYDIYYKEPAREQGIQP